MVGKRIVCSHGPRVRGDGVHLHVKISADRAPCDAVNLAVEVSRGMKVSGNRIRGQAGVIGIADRVVAPKRGRSGEVLIYAAKQIDVGSISRAAEPTSRCWERGNGRPSVSCG